MRIRVVIPVLNPEPSFGGEVVAMLEAQSVSADILVINSGDPIPDGGYECIPIDPKTFNHANTSL
jgi:hypothetical protein